MNRFLVCKQGSHPFSETNFRDFSRTFPGLFQDSDWFLQDSEIHINPFTPIILMPILLTVCHTFHVFYLSLTDFQNFPGPVALFQDFPVLENATIKFQDFPGFPRPVRTLLPITQQSALQKHVWPKERSNNWQMHKCHKPQELCRAVNFNHIL